MALGCGCGCGGRKAPGSCGGGASFDLAVNGFPMAYPITSAGLIMGAPTYSTGEPAVGSGDEPLSLGASFLGCPLVLWAAGGALAYFFRGKR